MKIFEQKNYEKNALFYVEFQPFNTIVNYILFEPVFPFHRACVLEQSDRKNSLIWAD